MKIQYKYPKLYDIWINLFHSKRLLEKFRYEVGENHSVFDVAAGYGRMARHMDSSNRYKGVDLNEIFVKHGKKQGLSLQVRDIFDRKIYKISDVFIAVDIVHHLVPDQMRRLFDLIFSHAKQKVIILEPSFESHMKRYGVLRKLFDRIFRALDDDGINKIERLMTDREYQQLFKSYFGSKYGKKFQASYEKIDRYFIAVFTIKMKSAKK